MGIQFDDKKIVSVGGIHDGQVIIRNMPGEHQSWSDVEITGKIAAHTAAGIKVGAVGRTLGRVGPLWVVLFVALGVAGLRAVRQPQLY